jgi:hypothetical protein
LADRDKAQRWLVDHPDLPNAIGEHGNAIES